MPGKASVFTTRSASEVEVSLASSIVSGSPQINYTHTNNCTLPKNEEENSIEHAAGNKFIRWLNELHLISRTNPLTEKYYRSESAVKQERDRHIKLNYWYIIHPLSKLRTYFDMWQLVLYITTMIIKPIIAALPTMMRRRITYFNEMSIILDLLSWMTIITRFFRGYIIIKTKVTILEPKRIAWHYITSIYFICDVLSSIPIPPLIYLCEVKYGTRHVFIVGFVYFCCQLKFIRIISVVKYINRLADYFRIKSKGKVFLLICIMITMLTVHFFALLQLLMPRLVRHYFSRDSDRNSVWYIKYNLHKKSFTTIYTSCVLKSSAFMLAIHVDFYKWGDKEEDYLLAIATYIVGKVLVCATYVIVAVSVLSNRSMEIKFFSIINQLDEYMRQKQLPLNLQDRIKNYYNFKFQHKYFNSERIHDMLPDKLKKEVNVHGCRNLILNVSLFANLTEEQISSVLQLLTPEIFLPKDTIIQAGSLGDSMYFISSGTVAVFTHSGKEVCHLEDGAFFGEIALVMQIRYRCATVIAIETTHVYMLKKKDFNRCMMKNPRIMKKVIKVAHRRFNEVREYEAIHKKMLFEKMHGVRPEFIE